MQKFLLVFLGVLIVAAISELVKGTLILSATVIGLILLARLYQASPKAFCAVRVTAAATVLPKPVWPWVGVTALVWLANEVAYAADTRVRRSARLRLPSA